MKICPLKFFLASAVNVEIFNKVTFAGYLVPQTLFSLLSLEFVQIFLSLIIVIIKF